MDKENLINYYLECAIKNKEDIQNTLERTREKAYKVLIYLIFSINISCGFLFSNNLENGLKGAIITFSIINLIIAYFIMKVVLQGDIVPNIYPIMDKQMINTLKSEEEVKNDKVATEAVNFYKTLEIEQAIKDYDTINTINTLNTHSINQAIEWCIYNFFINIIIASFLLF